MLTRSSRSAFRYWASKQSWRQREPPWTWLSQWKALSNLSYYHNPGKKPFLHYRVGDVVERVADISGDDTAIVSIHQGIRKHYADFADDINKLAAGLVSLGLEVGGKIGILSPNLYEWAVTQFAASRAGLVLVFINTAYQVHELEYCLQLTDCEALIMSEQFSRQDYYEMLLEITPELERYQPGALKSKTLPFLKHVILIGESPKPGTTTYQNVLESTTRHDYQRMHARNADLQFDDVVNLQFTSGTTGRPKAAQLSHFNIINNANSVATIVGFHEEKERICFNVPFIHSFGCVAGSLATFMHGSTLLLPAPSFKAKEALDCVTKERCTFLYGTPTMYIDMLHELEKGQYDVSSVRKGIIGGSPCPPEVVRNAIEKLNVQKLHIMYGITETSPGITSSDPTEPFEDWVHTVGRPIAHTEVKVVDKRGKIVPTGQEGELCTRGYHVFKGYLKDQNSTDAALDNGWYRTGDEAAMTKDGRVIIRGRIKDMIIRGGENVYPKEVEDFLYTHHDVQEVQVVGVPDERLGEEICAWIVLKEGKTLSQDDIKSFCKGQISHFKIPKYVLFVDDFPKTVTGKIQKFKLREKSRELLHL